MIASYAFFATDKKGYFNGSGIVSEGASTVR